MAYYNAQDIALGPLSDLISKPDTIRPNYYDIPNILQRVQGQALSNIHQSNLAEQRYTPQLFAARQGMYGQLNQDVRNLGLARMNANQGANALTQTLGYNPQQLNLPELGQNQVQDRVNQIALANLQNPYQLPTGVQNEVASGAAGRAALAGLLGGGGGRALVARDLGLSSLGVGQQNLNFGNQVGQQQQQLNLNQQALRNQIGQQNIQNQFANMSRIGDVSNFLNQYYAQQQAPLGLIASINKPQIGLDPGALAALITRNYDMTNQANAENAQANAAATSGRLQLYSSIINGAMKGAA